MSRVALAWCRAYTLAVPDDIRSRRREEVASFVWEASAAGVPGHRIAVGSAKGALDDVRWCRAERARASLAPLSATPMGSTLIAGAMVAMTFVLRAAVDRMGWSVAWLHYVPLLALVVLVVGYVDRMRQRRKGS